MREVGGGGGRSVIANRGLVVIWLINCQLTVIEGGSGKFYYETTKILLLLLLLSQTVSQWQVPLQKDPLFIKKFPYTCIVVTKFTNYDLQ